jgi:hypothetical protein
MKAREAAKTAADIIDKETTLVLALTEYTLLALFPLAI